MKKLITVDHICLFKVSSFFSPSPPLPRIHINSKMLRFLGPESEKLFFHFTMTCMYFSLWLLIETFPQFHKVKATCTEMRAF